MDIRERIAAKATEIYKQRYGKRKDISSKEIEQVQHDAAVEVQRQIRKEQL